jgi:DNA polymerase III subunit epsilon
MTNTQPALLDIQPWHEGPLAGFDVETNSPDPHTARIVSYAFVTDHAGGGHGGVLQPDGFEIPDEATAVHGISTEYAREFGQPRPAALARLRASFEAAMRSGTPVVIYNAPYDLTLLRREIPDLDMGRLLVLDPLLLDKQFDRYRKGSRKLGDTCKHYGVKLGADAHDALADTIAAVGLMRAIARVHPLLTEHSITGLQGQQRLWYAQQAESFERYLREKKNDPAATVDRSWPWKDTA